MKKQFKDAIKKAGGLAYAVKDNSRCFAASIQPQGFDGDGHAGMGAGYLKNYRIFAEYNESSKNLREGELIMFGDCTYAIKSISPALFKDEPVYLKGMLTLCEEGEL